VQAQQWRDGDGAEGIGGDPASCCQEPGGSVAQSAAGEPTSLAGVADAVAECVLGETLPPGVAQGAARELLGAGDARGAVAPGGAFRARLGRAAAAEVVEGDGLRPPGAAALLLPGVQPLADAGDRFRVPADGGAVVEGKRQEGERAGDYLYPL